MAPNRFAEQLVRDLNQSYSSAAPTHAANLVEDIETRIERELKEAILKNFAYLDESIRRTTGGFYFQDHAFEIVTGYREIIKSNSTLAVTIREVSQPSKPTIEHFSLSGIGKFKKVDLVCAPVLQQFAPSVAELTKGFYESGYAWLNEFLIEKARSLESSMAVELFRQIRMAFAGQPKLADVVSLCITDTTSGAYSFDQHATENMFFGLLTSEVPYKQTFSRHAVETGEPLHIDLSKAEYLDSKPLVALAEHALYKSATTGPPAATIFATLKKIRPICSHVFRLLMRMK